MPFMFNRRQFCNLSVGLTPLDLAIQDPEKSADADHVAVIFDILSRSFGLSESQRPLAAAFLERLMTPGMHGESPQKLRQWLANLSLYQQPLMAYVAEEFVVASNYFAVTSGHEPELRILSVDVARQEADRFQV